MGHESLTRLVSNFFQLRNVKEFFGKSSILYKKWDKFTSQSGILGCMKI